MVRGETASEHCGTDPYASGSVIRAYRFALDPGPLQEEQLRSHCGAQRFAYNWALRLVKANLEQRSAERTYGIADSELTPALNWSAYSLRRTWNTIKDDVAPWWRENSKEAYSSGLANLATALNNWAVSQSGDRQGRPMRFPRFKTKKSQLSCRFTTGAFGLVDTDRRHVKLPRIGRVRTHESTRKLARRVDRGSARIRSATVYLCPRPMVRRLFRRGIRLSRAWNTFASRRRRGFRSLQSRGAVNPCSGHLRYPRSDPEPGSIRGLAEETASVAAQGR